MKPPIANSQGHYNNADLRIPLHARSCAEEGMLSARLVAAGRVVVASRVSGGRAAGRRGSGCRDRVAGHPFVIQTSSCTDGAYTSYSTPSPFATYSKCSADAFENVARNHPYEISENADHAGVSYLD